MDMPATTPPRVYQCIAAVMADVAKEGIAKDRRNGQQGYNFRGIDDVYNVLSPILAKHGLCVLPRVLSRSVTERETQKGGVLFYVTVEAEFDFIAADDGSRHVVKTYGEAMDSADKATNKAMSAAYKYAAMQAFCIPTEGDNDADAHTPEPAARARTDTRRPMPDHVRDHPHAPPNEDAIAYQAKARSAIQGHTDKAELGEWWNSPAEKEARRAAGLTAAQVDNLKQLVLMRMDEIAKAPRPLVYEPEDIPF